MGLAETIRDEALLVILSELSGQPGAQCGASLIQQLLQARGLKRGRGWLRERLLELETLGAVELDIVARLVVADHPRNGRKGNGRKAGRA